MTLSRLLTTAVLVIALVSMWGETTSDAQVVSNRTVLTPPSLPDGIEQDGVVWQFKTGSRGTHAPTILGILTPPHVEPTLASQSGAMWVFCAGPTEATTCTLKVNVLGTPFEMGRATWSLE